MSSGSRVGAFARRYWKHLVVAHGTAIATGLALFFTAFQAAPAIVTVFGQRLDHRGQRIYSHVVSQRQEQGMRGETPPAAVIAKLNEIPTLKPRTLATPEPIRFTSLVRNQSSRHGAHVLLWIVHDAEMPSACVGLQGLHAIAAWFNNPSAQASSNYSTDACGNSVLMVPTSAKAWTQAWFNSVSISDELLGYASQLHWPEAQLRAAAQLAAHDAIRYGIPVRLGAVNGCAVTRAGFLQHNDLGGCGGGHHDAGPHFPMPHFLALVREYVAALTHPTPKPTPTPKPRPRCTVKQLQRALNAHGAHLAVDGVDGPLTRAALRRVGFTHLKLGCRL